MRASLAIAAALALLLTGCGETDGPTMDRDAAGDPAAQAGTPDTGQPWLVRFETGDDEAAGGVAYVRFVPETGETEVTEIELGPIDAEPNPTTLVDADRSWAVALNAATRREQRSAALTVHSLTGADDLELDLREVTGVADLRPLGWGFDPEQPGLLRVLDRSGRVFEVDVVAGTASEGEPLTAGKGRRIAPLFDSATGKPLLRNMRTYEPDGGGPYAAGGLSVVDPYDVPDSLACGDEAPLSAAVVDATSTTWAACLQGREVRLAARPDGAEDWTVEGASRGDVPRDTRSMTWVLPPL